MRISHLAAALAVSCLAGLAINGGARAAGYGDRYAQACAGGYHTDSEGNCQPNVAQTNRYCPPGEVYHPYPDGWFCDSPSGRTYY